jgi:hypothetical protein
MTVAWENIVSILCRECLVAAGMNESGGQLVDTRWSAVIGVARKAGNVVAAKLEESGLAFFIGGSWQRNAPPHKWRVSGIGRRVNVKGV